MTIHLLSTISASYVVPFRVTAHSLARHRRDGVPIVWHVFEPDLSGPDRASIEAGLQAPPIEIVWHRYSEERLAALPVWGRGVPAMYERILAPANLPGAVERVIYLDADLLVLDDVARLWTADLGGAVLGAVQDPVIPFVSSPLGLGGYHELGFDKSAPYFNAGVLVVDLEAWRAQQVTERALAYARERGRAVNLADQDALNAVLGGRWALLDDRWNVVGGLAGRAGLEPPGIGTSRMAAAIRDPAIVHFSGYLKPWLYDGLGSRWAAAYHEALGEACPGHACPPTARGRAISFYDRRVRRWLYPLERLAWRSSRYLR